MRRAAVLSVMLLVASTAVMSAQTPLCVTLRIEFPSDDPDEGTVEIRTAEGRATAGVQLPHGDEHRDFYLDLTVRDATSGLVAVSVRNDRGSDRIADEFELRVGGDAVQTVTNPPFRLTALRVSERVSYSCAYE